MNRAALLAASRVYFDANAMIYYIEGQARFRTAMAEIFQLLLESEKQLVTSEMAAAECLYGAYRDGSAELEAKYRELFFETGVFEILPIDFALLDASAKIGAEKKLKLIDAVHFCSAYSAACEVLVTNDARFVSSHGVEVVGIGGA